MATTSAPISLDEYLSTNYCPDREYIDGEVVERNMGKWRHARIQALLTMWFGQHESLWRVQTATASLGGLQFPKARPGASG
jgi:hypothetical protein